MNIRGASHLIQAASVVVLGLLMGLAVTRTGKLPVPSVEVVWSAPPGAYRPSFQWAERQLMLVYVGSPSCGWSTLDWIPGVLDSIKIILRDKAAERDLSFSTLGIARDWSADDGVSHLRWVGAFDEIAAGYGWMNSAALKYLWQDFPGEASTPQLLLLYRQSRIPGQNEADRGFEIEAESLVQRVVGANEIRRWLADGVPIRAGLPSS